MWTIVLASALAAPGTLPITGYLTDALGVPVDGPQPTTFRLYADDGDATADWSEVATITYDQGRFSAQLGLVTALDMDLFVTDDTRVMSLQVQGDSESDRVDIAGCVEAVADDAKLGTRAGLASQAGGARRLRV